MSFTHLIRFESKEDGKLYFANSPILNVETGSRLEAYQSLDDLLSRKSSTTTTIGKLLAPVPSSSLPIYCVGLNYRSHANEASLSIPKAAPLWTKPCTSLANPDEDIEINPFCASNGLDYEGELVFVTSATCKDITPEQASDYILGYTVGNDLSCRLQQLPDVCGGQYFFAKAFDKFAPIGPALISPRRFGNEKDVTLTTRVNGEVVQQALVADDMIYTPAQVLSRMSQGTTIPAGTAVMTGTPAGAGFFCEPRRWLKDGDVVEVELSGDKEVLLTLKNRVVFVG